MERSETLYSDPTIIEAAARALRDESYMFFEMDEAQRLAGAILAAAVPLIRAAALEEAAKTVEDYDGEFEEIHMAQGDIAAAIRALKEQLAHSLNRAIANGQLKRLNAERAVLEAKIALCNARLAQIDLWLDAAETICPGILSKLGYAVEEPRP
jgi:chromosome segregation ATPase